MENEIFLKLSEWWFGNRVLTVYIEKNGQMLYCKMFSVIDEKMCEHFCHEIDVEATNLDPNFQFIYKPFTDEQNKKTEELKNKYKPYNEKYLKIGNKNYEIYPADRNYVPWKNAVAIKLTNEELLEWEKEIKNWEEFNSETYEK